MAKRHYTAEQLRWCETYRSETGFTPIMDSFECGKATFFEAAASAIRWYEAHASDVHLRIQRALPPQE
ncbi:hypothetical protein SAMN03159335_06329 [Burkholderia cepacia]|nr:hypothetical protein SAMN03159335_06329 [Burkholderia cepacia]